MIYFMERLVLLLIFRPAVLVIHFAQVHPRRSHSLSSFGSALKQALPIHKGIGPMGSGRCVVSNSLPENAKLRRMIQEEDFFRRGDKTHMRETVVILDEV